MCGNQFRETLEYVENNHVTNVAFISAFPLLRTVMMDNIDDFKKLRKKKKSKSRDIDETILENYRSIPSNYFTRREKWFVLLDWFIRLKQNQKELKKLKNSDEKLFEFRKSLLYEFQRSALKISDKDFPNKVASTLVETWDYVTRRWVKRIERLLTFNELKAVLCSFETMKLLSRACLQAVGKSKFIKPGALSTMATN
jgi:hypothetical protein